MIRKKVNRFKKKQIIDDIIKKQGFQKNYYKVKCLKEHSRRNTKYKANKHSEAGSTVFEMKIDRLTKSRKKLFLN